MAENDLTVTIGVDTSGLDAGMARVKEATQGLGGAAPSAVPFDPIAAHLAKYKDVPKENAAALQAYEDAAKKATGAINQLSKAQDGLATSSERARVKEATQGLGGAAPSAVPFDPIAAHLAKYKDVPKENVAALQAYEDAAKKATGVTNQLSKAQDGLATSSERAASGFERMVGRMLTRLGIFYVIHEAIKLITEVLQESSAYEAAQVRFENLSVAVEGSAKAWEHLRQVAHETGISQEELGQAQMSLEKMGVSGGEASGVMENLAKYAKILGVDIGTVAQEFGRVELKRGSIQDMQDLAYATHNIGLQRMVNDLAEAQRMAPILAMEQAQLDRQINRAADDQDRALNRAIEDTDRLRNAQLSVAQAIGSAGKAYQEFISGSSAGGPAGQMTARLKSEMAFGEAQLAREGEPSVQQMRQMGVSGREIYQVLMQAAQRYHEQVRIDTQRQEEDEKRLREQEQEDARENLRLQAAFALLKAQDKITKAIEQGIGADSAFAETMETAEGLSDLIKEHMQEIVDDAKDINDAIKGWNTMILNFIDNIKQVGVIIDNVLKKIQQLVPWHPAVHDPTLETPEETAARRAPHPNRVPGFLGRPPEPTAADKYNEMLKKQDEHKKEQQDANKKLGQIHGVLQQAFGT